MSSINLSCSSFRNKGSWHSNSCCYHSAQLEASSKHVLRHLKHWVNGSVLVLSSIASQALFVLWRVHFTVSHFPFHLSWLCWLGGFLEFWLLWPAQSILDFPYLYCVSPRLCHCQPCPDGFPTFMSMASNPAEHFGQISVHVRCPPFGG